MDYVLGDAPLPGRQVGCPKSNLSRDEITSNFDQSIHRRLRSRSVNPEDAVSDQGIGGSRELFELHLADAIGVLPLHSASRKVDRAVLRPFEGAAFNQPVDCSPRGFSVESCGPCNTADIALSKQ